MRRVNNASRRNGHRKGNLISRILLVFINLTATGQRAKAVKAGEQ